jgi:hypothetical protein
MSKTKMTWQPIETAPIDTPILVCLPSWYKPEEGRCIVTLKYKRERYGFHGIYGYEPTHWMPIPELPS